MQRKYFLLFFFLFSECKQATETPSTPTLTVAINKELPNYFTVNGTPTLLLGGSNNDNIFQDHPIEPQLDTLIAYGGNYIRCTLSSRDFANQWPYQQRGDALYDLNIFSEAYWSRLDKFFKLTQEKGIIVQLEIWDTRDYKQVNNWAKHPFNPYYNVNFTEETSGLPVDITDTSSHPFFETVPTLDNNQLVLSFQEKLIEKLLSHTFKYNHILYCINNEFTGNEAWSSYWAKFIKQQAEKANHSILLTDMFGDLEQTMPSQLQILKNTNFDFADVSMQSILKGETFFQYIASLANSLGNRPITLVKVYGGEQNDFTGTFEDGPERFWKSIFGGAAAIRFHQPPQGAGLNRLAQVNIKSLRMLSDSVNFFELEPMNESLIDRQENEVFALGNTKAYLLYYPGCGEVNLALETKKVQVKWLNILNAKWEESYQIDVDSTITLKSPCEGKWAAWVKVL